MMADLPSSNSMMVKVKQILHLLLGIVLVEIYSVMFVKMQFS